MRFMIPIILFFTTGCNPADKTKTEKSTLPAKEMRNIQYGKHTEQRLDVYLPAGRNEETKTFILLHGGGWSGGSKDSLNYMIPVLKREFPNHAIVNMDYRLATFDSPAFPKQVQDIEKAIQFLKESDYNISNEYAFIGVSAGGHLAMLYSYKHDKGSEVKAVCSIVGPADFTDPFYVNHPYYRYASLYLLGQAGTKPEAALEISPARFVTPKATPTILFYGGKDPLVPASQAKRLKAKLDEHNVPNALHVYDNGGHGNWSIRATNDFQQKMIAFFKERF